MTENEKKLLQEKHRLEETEMRDRQEGAESTDTAADPGGSDFRKGLSRSGGDESGKAGGFFILGITMSIAGAFRETGALLFFFRRAHLLTAREAGSGIAYGNRALCEADAAPAGALWTMPHHSGAAVIVHAVIAITPAFAFVSRGTTLPHLATTACGNLPPAAFPQ